LHNWASHPADAFSYGAQVMAEHKAPDPVEPARYPAMGQNGRIVTATLDELWATAPTRSERI